MNQQSSRPAKVGTAVNLFYISLGIGAARSIMEASMLLQMETPEFVMFTIFFTLGASWFLFYMIGKGHN